jgi:ferredoxin
MFSIQTSKRLLTTSRVIRSFKRYQSITVSAKLTFHPSLDENIDSSVEEKPFSSFQSRSFHNATIPVFPASQVRYFHPSLDENIDSSIEKKKISSFQSRSFHNAVENKVPISISFVDKYGDKRDVTAYEGDDVLSVALANKIDIEGACEGTCCCSTCHITLSPDVYDKLDEPFDEELDMLDLAPGVTDTSRLGCQTILTKNLDGAQFQLPDEVQNFY